jgi:hypothetical protein
MAMHHPCSTLILKGSPAGKEDIIKTIKAFIKSHCRGIRGRTGLAEAIEERAAVLEAAERLVAEYGLKEAGRRIGLALDTGTPPSPDELALAMEGHVVIRLILAPCGASRRRWEERR